MEELEDYTSSALDRCYMEVEIVSLEPGSSFKPVEVNEYQHIVGNPNRPNITFRHARRYPIPYQLVQMAMLQRQDLIRLSFLSASLHQSTATSSPRRSNH